MARNPVGAITGSSQSPIHLFSGTITPIDLQFERHHAGVPTIDPTRHQLLIHGKVERPLVFTLDDLKRFPSVTRIHFLECSGNGRAAYRTPKAELSPQQVDGLLSNAEWTGVPLKFLLSEVGLRSGATWVLAEGSDAARLSRSVPLEKLMDDALVAYAQNGEPLRPSGGFPMRLLLPGWEGNANVKWLRRLELIDQPNMSRDETSKYTDPLPNDTARQFSFVLDAKSIITAPSFPSTISGKGWVRVSGVAWSGRGRIAAVDVSADGGSSWTAATLQESVLPKSLTRFELMWEWDGTPARLMSRAVDETGYVQPTYEEFKAARGLGTDYHYNYIRTWAVAQDGHVSYGVPA
jgi:sulfane dehydrogenase subunit SoxC